MFLNAKYQWFVINYRHIIKICDHRKGFPVKEISQSDHSRGSGSHSPHVRDGRCWDRSPFASRGCTEPTAASLESLLTPPSLRRGFPGRVSDVPFHGTIYSRLSNTETARAGASEEDPEQRNPHSLLHPHSPSLKSPKPRSSSGALGSCCVSQCPFPRPVPPLFVRLVMRRVGRSRPLVSVGSHPELHQHLSLYPELQLAERATCTRCILQHFPQF